MKFYCNFLKNFSKILISLQLNYIKNIYFINSSKKNLFYRKMQNVKQENYFYWRFEFLHKKNSSSTTLFLKLK